MNMIFRVIWSSALQTCIVASELAKGIAKASSSGTLSSRDMSGKFALAGMAALACTLSSQSIAAVGTVIATGTSLTVEDTKVVATGNRADVGQNSMGLSAGNNGSISFSGGSVATSGRGGLGAIANNNSTLLLSNTDISTSGITADGITSQNNSSVTANNVNVSTTNSQAAGLKAVNGRLLMKNSAVTTTGASSIGALANGATASLTLDNSTVSTTGNGSHGIDVENGGQASLTNSTISAKGYMAYGVLARDKGTVVSIDDSFISTEGGSSEAVLTRDGGTINVRKTTVNTSGINNYALRAYGTGSSVDFRDGTLNTTGEAISVQAYGEGSEVRLQNTTINTARNGLASTHGRIVADNIVINNTGAAATPAIPAIGIISGYKEGVAVVSNVQINSTGEGIEGVRAWGGARVDLDGAELNHSLNGIGLVTTQSGTIEGNNVAININSRDDLQTSAGVWMGRDPGSNLVSLTNSYISLTGTNSAGLVSQSDGVSDNTLNLTDSIMSAPEGTAISVYGNADTKVNVSGSAITGSTLLATGKNNAGTVSNVVINGNNASVLVGDIVINRPATGMNALNLDNRSGWTGSTNSLENLNLKNGSQWNLTHSSGVDNVTLENGVINLSSTNSAFNRLTLNKLASNGGHLNFKTQLGEDNSLTDSLHITGNYDGNTIVSVQNAGGTGAQTLQGIELIRVDGDINGTFTQQGRIVAGAYDYSLVNESNRWLLKSEAVVGSGGGTGPGEGSEADSGNGSGAGTGTGEGAVVTPVKSAPVTRPEAASYFANLAAANTLFRSSMSDRSSVTNFTDINGVEHSTSLWLRNSGGHTRSGDSTGQLKTTANRYVLQLGGDLLQWTNDGADRFRFGVMGGYATGHHNTHSAVSGHNAKGEIKGYSSGVYATWLQNESEGLGAYVDGWMLYNWFDNNVKGQAIAGESYKSKGITAAVETGYTFKVADLNQRDSFFVQPKMQANWMGVKADAHQEENGTRIEGIGNNNVQTRIGVRAFLKGHSALDDQSGRSFEPYVEANWVHNTEAFGTRLNDVVIQQAGTRNIGEVKLGVDAKLSKAVQLWGNVGQQVGASAYSDTSAMLGVKVSF